MPCPLLGCLWLLGVSRSQSETGWVIGIPGGAPTLGDSFYLHCQLQISERLVEHWCLPLQLWVGTSAPVSRRQTEAQMSKVTQTSRVPGLPMQY